MRVSVIVPARNAETTIGACLAALRGQSLPPDHYEVLVVDDGSTDRTAEIAEQDGARVIRIPPSGPAAARNRGVAAARGETVVFTDADCAPDPEWLEAMTASFADPGVSAAKGVYRTEQASLTAQFVQLEYESRYRRMARYPSIDFIDTYSAAFRRDLYLSCGGSDESFTKACTEDQELGFRYARQGGVIKFVPTAVVRHLHADSPLKYFRKKLKIGYWKVPVLSRHPGKASNDSHTPPSVKIEMAAAMLSFGGVGLWAAGLGPWVLAAAAALFALSAAPLVLEAFRRRPVLGLASPGLLLLRAYGLGLGFASGFSWPILSSGRMLAVWAVAILAAFLMAAGSLVGSTVGFFANAVLLALMAYLALFSGFRLLRAPARKLPAEEGLDPLERTALEGALGLGVLMGGVFILGALQLYRPIAAYALLAALAIGKHVPFWRDLRARWQALAGAPPGQITPARRERVLAACLVIVGCMTFFESLTPATAQDALAYHLAVPAKYIEHGGIRYVPESFFAQFPANMEMLFTLALLVRGSPLAGACHWLTGAFATLAVAAVARCLAGSCSGTGSGGGRCGLMAAALFATVPTAALIAGWAYVDLALVLFEVTSTLAFLRWWRLGASPAAGNSSSGNSSTSNSSTSNSSNWAPRWGWLALAGGLAGLAAGCKYTGGAQGLLLVGGVLVEAAFRRRPWRRAASATAVAALATAVVASPWWIKNVVFTGNPLYPFLYGIFGGKNWDSERAMVLSAFLGDWGRTPSSLLEALRLPWDVTMSARFFSIEDFDGVIGPAFLMGLPLLAAALLRGRSTGAGVVFLFAAGHALFWLALSRQVRFLLPALALSAGLLGSAIHPFVSRWGGRVAMGALRLGVAYNVLLIATHFAAHNPLPVVLGLEREGAYLAREVPGGDYPVFAWIEKHLPEDSYILFGGCGNPGFLCKREYHADPLFENRTLAEILRAGKSPDGVREEFRRRGFTHVLFRWDLVFDPSGRRSEIPLHHQVLLATFLNKHGQLMASARGTVVYSTRHRTEQHRTDQHRAEARP